MKPSLKIEASTRALAIAASGILIALSLGMHSLHNHEADPVPHPDCPVFRYELVLDSTLIFIFALIQAFLVSGKPFIKPIHPLCSIDRLERCQRSPPF